MSFAEKAVNKYIDNISAADSDTPVLTLGGRTVSPAPAAKQWPLLEVNPAQPGGAEERYY
ncbi:hypothetical protein F7P08_07120 [Klebsiella pneumoniae]|nr:hypothetical protein F7P08_07120 [Klebsiella pneumoniae]